MVVFQKKIKEFCMISTLNPFSIFPVAQPRRVPYERSASCKEVVDRIHPIFNEMPANPLALTFIPQKLKERRLLSRISLGLVGLPEGEANRLISAGINRYQLPEFPNIVFVGDSFAGMFLAARVSRLYKSDPGREFIGRLCSGGVVELSFINVGGVNTVMVDYGPEKITLPQDWIKRDEAAKVEQILSAIRRNAWVIRISRSFPGGIDKVVELFSKLAQGPVGRQILLMINAKIKEPWEIVYKRNASSVIAYLRIIEFDLSKERNKKWYSLDPNRESRATLVTYDPVPILGHELLHVLYPHIELLEYVEWDANFRGYQLVEEACFYEEFRSLTEQRVIVGLKANPIEIVPSETAIDYERGRPLRWSHYATVDDSPLRLTFPHLPAEVIRDNQLSFSILEILVLKREVDHLEDVVEAYAPEEFSRDYIKVTRISPSSMLIPLLESALRKGKLTKTGIEEILEFVVRQESFSSFAVLEWVLLNIMIDWGLSRKIVVALLELFKNNSPWRHSEALRERIMELTGIKRIDRIFERTITRECSDLEDPDKEIIEVVQIIEKKSQYIIPKMVRRGRGYDPADTV